MSSRRTSNNWPAIYKKRKAFIEAIKRAIEVQDLKTPKRVQAYVICHTDDIVTASLKPDTANPVKVIDHTTDSESLDGYITIDECSCDESQCDTSY